MTRTGQVSALFDSVTRSQGLGLSQGHPPLEAEQRPTLQTVPRPEHCIRPFRRGSDHRRAQLTSSLLVSPVDMAPAWACDTFM